VTRGFGSGTDAGLIEQIRGTAPPAANHPCAGVCPYVAHPEV
jgi:hypothetical protein